MPKIGWPKFAKRGVRQYIMLGAGLDTFPWRQPSFALPMRLFAVDHPASLAFASERARSGGLPDPRNLTRVPIDLEQDDFLAKLTDAGCELVAPSFFSILGVLQYLSPNSVNALLKAVAMFAPGSETVLSFALVDESLDEQDVEAAKQSLNFTRNAGEPWRSRFHPLDLQGRLLRLGFHELFHLTPDMANERYFSGRHDNLKAPGWEQLVAAVI